MKIIEEFIDFVFKSPDSIGKTYYVLGQDAVEKENHLLLEESDMAISVFEWSKTDVAAWADNLSQGNIKPLYPEYVITDNMVLLRRVDGYEYETIEDFSDSEYDSPVDAMIGYFEDEGIEYTIEEGDDLIPEKKEDAKEESEETGVGDCGKKIEIYGTGDTIKPLYMKHDESAYPQPANLYISLENESAWFDYDPNTGNARTIEEWCGITRTISISPEVTLDELCDLASNPEVVALVETVINGGSISWDGRRHVGVLDKDAQEAEEKLADILGDV